MQKAVSFALDASWRELRRLTGASHRPGTAPAERVVPAFYHLTLMEQITQPSLKTGNEFEPALGRSGDRDRVPGNPSPLADSVHDRVLPESGIEAALRRAEVRLRMAGDRLREQIRDYPAESVFLAAAGGYLCKRLPVQSLLITGFKIFSAFAPPSLLALGICKLAEYSRRWDAQHPSRRRPSISPMTDSPVLVVTDNL